MKLNKIAVGSMLLLAGGAYAVDESIEAAVQFRQALSLTKNFDIDFTPGATFVDFAGTPGASDFVQLATNGTVSYAGTAFSGNTAGQAADVSILGDGISAVNISCSTGATLSNGTNTLSINQTQLSVNTGDAFGSADHTCAGLGTSPLAHTLDGTDKVLLGGRIVGDSGVVTSGIYNTTNPSGIPAAVRVVYQ
jgi:hypothetical protein